MRPQTTATSRARSGHSRRSILLYGAALGGTFCMQAEAPVLAEYHGTVRLIVGYTAGGGVDAAARVLAKAFEPTLSPSVIVDNRPGAGSTIGIRDTVNASADGSVGLFGSSSGIAIAPAVYKDIPYDPTKDLTAVGLVSLNTSVLVVRPDLPVKTLSDFIAYAKAHSGNLRFGSSGVGTGPHLQGVRFATLIGTKATHVPYRGGAQALTDLMAGRIDFMIDFLGLCLPQIQAGNVRALAVIARGRDPVVPDVPTMQEADLPQMDSSSWNGLFLPPRVAGDVLDQWSAALKKALAEPEVAHALTSQGSQIVTTTPQQFANFVADEVVKWKRLAESAGVEPS
jgi:tripartite-type tricarboxylate transporter receptor subunit TctC